MGLRRVVGAAVESPKPYRLRLWPRHVRWPRRSDGRLRLGRGGANVPYLRSPRPGRPPSDVLSLLLLVRLVQQGRAGRRVIPRGLAAGGLLLRSGRRRHRESVNGRQGLDLLRHRTVITGNRFGRLRRGFRFAGLKGSTDSTFINTHTHKRAIRMIFAMIRFFWLA